MKNNSLIATIALSALLLTGCMQPYSSKSFYKAQGATNAPSSADDVPRSLSYADITAVSTLSKPTEQEISKALRKLNPHWRIKGFERATGTVFFFNFSSKNDEETFIWHSKENTAEYVTTNTNHYTAIVNELKTGGYQPAGNSAAGDQHYANGDKKASIVKVVIFNQSTGYKFSF